MKSITLSELKKNYPNIVWCETKIKGDSKYRETKISSISKSFNFVDDKCISFESYKNLQKTITIASVEVLKIRVEIWDSKNKQNNYYKRNI